jgi:4-amino-4-deoxy-L-arabinose transferase-like glycosyltransferase
MTRRAAYAVVAAAAVVPRLVVLLHERDDILASFTEKSDRFARTFVDDGTFGFIPGEPSAWTQPLYSFFLIPIYWIAGREWWSVGFAQIVVAAATAIVVYETGRRFLSPRAGLVAALVATLSPYLVWHDVHVNRELLDQLLAAVVVFLTLLVGERRGGLPAAALLGLAIGLAILGNSRLVLLPLVIAGYLLWRRKGWQTVGVTLAACVLALLPWLVRNDVNVGCFTLTTDSRALWKANNLATYDVLDRGGWIDDVPNLRGAPPWPELAADLSLQGRPTAVDECAQMRLYRREVIDFWQEHPGEKARLMGQAARMLWDPRSIRTEGRAEAGGFVDDARTWAQPVYMIPLYVLAVIGLVVMPRRIAVLFVALLVYNTLAALMFAGATRYRVPWDFVLALAAGAAVVWLLDRRRSRPSAKRTGGRGLGEPGGSPSA